MVHSADRILWADHVKAFAIWLMVLAHLGMHNAYWETVIYSFHMPVFFFISGYFDKGKEFSLALLKKSAKSLIVPYFFFSICAFSICWVSPYLHPELYHHGSIPQSFLKAFVGLFLMEDQVRSYAFMPLGPLWFLVSLFWVRVFFAMGCSLWRGRKFLLILFGIILCLIFVYRFPFFSLDSACLSLPIYLAGYLCKKFDLFRFINRNWRGCLIACICVVYVVLVSEWNGSVSVDGCVYGDSLLMFFVNSLIGSVACIAVFKILNIRCSYLSKIGGSTITILGTHFYIRIAGYVAGVLLLSISPSSPPLWYPFLLSFIAIPVGVVVHSWLLKKCPNLLGK